MKSAWRLALLSVTAVLVGTLSTRADNAGRTRDDRRSQCSAAQERSGKTAEGRFQGKRTARQIQSQRQVAAAQGGYGSSSRARGREWLWPLRSRLWLLARPGSPRHVGRRLWRTLAEQLVARRPLPLQRVDGNLGTRVGQSSRWFLANNPSARVRTGRISGGLAVLVPACGAVLARPRRGMAIRHRQGRFAQREREYRPVPASASSDKLYADALWLFWDNNFESARDHLAAAIKQSPRDARLWYYKALSERALGNEQTARRSAEKGGSSRFSRSRTSG